MTSRVPCSWEFPIIFAHVTFAHFADVRSLVARLFFSFLVGAYPQDPFLQQKISKAPTIIRQDLKKAAESFPRSQFGIDQISEDGMTVPQQSPVENIRFPRLELWFCNDHPLRMEGCRKYSKVKVWDRSTFRSSNDGSATIIGWECHVSSKDRPVLLMKDGLVPTNFIHYNYKGCRKYSKVMVWDRSTFRSSNDGSATIIGWECHVLSSKDRPVLLTKDGLMPTNFIHYNYKRLQKVFQGQSLG
eukprot:scaffold19881_cov78-Cylindrotheca_fusiformis.AAC.1